MRVAAAVARPAALPPTPFPSRCSTWTFALLRAGSRRVTDAGLGRLASSPSLAAQLTSLTVSHTAATDGSICELLARCSGLRALAVRGLLFNADSTAARLASNCR